MAKVLVHKLILTQAEWEVLGITLEGSQMPTKFCHIMTGFQKKFNAPPIEVEIPDPSGIMPPGTVAENPGPADPTQETPVPVVCGTCNRGSIFCKCEKKENA